MLEIFARQAVTGYQSSSNPLLAREGSVVSGSKNLLILGTGRPQLAKGPVIINAVTGGRVMYNIPDGGYASLGDATTQGIGSISGIIARAFAFVGGGPLYINGISRSVSASTTPQLILYKSGSYSGLGTGPFTMGLSRPSAPTIATTPTVNTDMSGTVAAEIWFVRSATGGRSRASLPSNVLVVDGKTVRITISGADLTTASNNGYDRIGVAVTLFGFGFSGPFYEYKDATVSGEIPISSLTTVDGVANSYELAWTNGSLAGSDLAPGLDFQPPPFVFLAGLEDVLAGIGACGDISSGVSTGSPGTAIVVSLPVFIESFPPDSILFLPEAPTGVLSRASEGFCFVACKNSLHALLYTGGKNPLSLRTVWAQVGFANQKNMTLAEGGRLYGMSSGKRGLVRIGESGEPETEWAADVVEDVRGWAADNVITGWDGDHQIVAFGHVQTILCFAPAARGGEGAWSAPYDLTGKITGNLCACVTVQGGLLLAANDGSTIRLYTFNAGTGMVCEVYFPLQAVDAESATLTRVKVSLRADNTANPVQVKIFVNGDPTPAYDSGDITLSRTGQVVFSVPRRPNVRGARIFQSYLKMTGTGGNDCGPDAIQVEGEKSNVVISGVAA